MAITLDELLGMNTKSRKDETVIDRFPSYDDFARRTRRQSEEDSSFNTYIPAPRSNGARSVEFMREHEASRPYSRPMQSEYQNLDYGFEAMRARREAQAVQTIERPVFAEPACQEESVNTLYEYARQDKERPSDRELYDRLASTSTAVVRPTIQETQRTSEFSHIKTKQKSESQKKARLNTKGKILLGVYVAVIILVAVLIIVNAGDLNSGSATTPSSSISGVVNADANASNIAAVPEIEFNHGTYNFHIK